MDGINKSARKSVNGAPRKVRCPKCKEILIEPIDLPLYRCGVCSTVLQAKHYKGPPLDIFYGSHKSGSISSRSNASIDGSEGNEPMEKKSESVLGDQNIAGIKGNGSVEKGEFVLMAEQNLAGAMDARTMKDGVFRNGSNHSNSGSEISLKVDITQEHEGLVSDMSSDQLEKSPTISTSGLENYFPSSSSNLKQYAASRGDSPQIESPDGESEMDELMHTSELVFSKGQTSENIVDINSKKCRSVELDSSSSNSDHDPLHYELRKIEDQESVPQINILAGQMDSSIMEIHEYDSQCLYLESDGGNTAGPENILCNAPLMSNVVTLDEQMHQTPSENTHLIIQQSLECANMDEISSVKDALPEINSKPDCSSRERLFTDNLSDDLENKKEILVSSEVVDQSSDSFVDNLESNHNLSFSRDSGHPIATSMSSLGDVADIGCNDVEYIADAQDVKTISLNGFVSEPDGNSLLSSVEQGKELENHENQENISCDENLSNNVVKLDERMHQTNSEHMHLNTQENFGSADIDKTNSVKNDLPEVNSMPDWNFKECVPIENKHDDQGNKKGVVISYDQADRNLDAVVGTLESKCDLTISHDSSPTASTLISMPTLSDVGDAGSSSHLPSGEQGQEPKNDENHNETQTTGLSTQVATSLNVGNCDFRNMRSSNAEDVKSDRTVMDVNTTDRGLGSGAVANEKFLSIPAQHKPEISSSSLEDKYSPSRQRSHFSKGASDFQDNKERKFSHDNNVGSSRNITLDPNDALTRNVRHSFQRISSEASEGYRSMNYRMETEKEKFLRSLSRFSDSSEFDRERELLNKIEELRSQLLRAHTFSRMGSGAYDEGRTHHSQASFGSEYEYSQSSPSFSRHSTFRAENYIADENLPQMAHSPKASHYGMHYSSHQFPPPNYCIHSNLRSGCAICSHHSEDDVSTSSSYSRGFHRENEHRKGRNYDLKHYCRPILGAAQFLSCYKCFQVLQIPEAFDFLASRYKQLRCGSCLEILEFSVLGKTQIIPFPREAMESTEMSVGRNSHQGKATCSEDGSYSNEIEHGHASRNSDVPSQRRRIRRKAGDQLPLHELMGYFSASEIIYQDLTSDNGEM